MNLLDKLIYHCSQPRLRLLHSLFFNFKLLPIKQAIKLPIYIYGPIKFYWLCGKIELRSEKIFSGMIQPLSLQFYIFLSQSSYYNQLTTFVHCFPS